MTFTFTLFVCLQTSYSSHLPTAVVVGRLKRWHIYDIHHCCDDLREEAYVWNF